MNATTTLLTNMAVSNKAVTKYHKDKTTLIQVRVTKSKDKDILDKLASVTSKSGYIKDLIRNDIKIGN